LSNQNFPIEILIVFTSRYSIAHKVAPDKGVG